VVFEDGEKLAEFPGVPNAKAVKGLNDNRLDLPGLDAAQEALEVGPLVGLVPAFVVLKPLVDFQAGSLNGFALAERVLFVGAASQVRNGRHDVCSPGVVSTLAPGLQRSQRKITKVWVKSVYTHWKRWL
jgi:hypothetical protein